MYLLQPNFTSLAVGYAYISSTYFPCGYITIGGANKKTVNIIHSKKQVSIPNVYRSYQFG